jgi:putative addiction module killer protein
MSPPIPKKVFKTKEFSEWQESLRDNVTKASIDARIKRLQFGNSGDAKPVGAGVSELRIKLGPGWRIYFHETKAGALILLLNGGDKSTQDGDIKEAKRILKALKDKQAKAKAVAKAGTAKGGKG